MFVMRETVSVLFVCMGNICRSPTAHGVFERMVKDAGLRNVISVDSAGTHSYHIGNQPDARSQEVALRRGFDLSHVRARRFQASDFDDFDYLLAMDNDNLLNMQAIASAGQHSRVELFLDYASDATETEVPDPYYGGPKGFEHVLDLVESAAKGLLQNILEKHPVHKTT